MSSEGVLCSQNTQANTNLGAYFFNKVADLQACTGLELYQKIILEQMFPVNLRNFQEQLFYRTTVNGCF